MLVTFVSHSSVDAEVEDARDLGVEDLAREAVARDAVAHHAAGLGPASRIVTACPRRARW